MKKHHVEIKFKPTHEKSQLPATHLETPLTGNSGYDLMCVEEVTIPGRSDGIVKTGIQVAYITPGYWFRIEPRSGLGFKNGLQPHLGVIDEPYRGDLGVKIYNFSDQPYTFKVGDKCAQMVVYELIQPNISWADEVEQTARGANGFGSSGR